MFKKILWATDGSEAADKALPYIETLAKQDGASVEVLHVVEYLVGGKAAEPAFADEPDLKKKLEDQVEQLKAGGADARLHVVGGLNRNAAHAIADEANETGADLIVVATRGHTAFGGMIVGSVTQRLLHLAAAPVMAVPAHD